MKPLFAQPILALDTAAGASACLLFADGTSDAVSMHTPRAHSRELLPMLQGLLAKHDLSWQELGAFAVGVGPGSFTGLRVACATVAGLNASLRKPVYGLCSLSITARQAAENKAVWAIEDARSQLVYAAQYERGRVVTPPKCMTWDAFMGLTPSCYISVSDIPVALEPWQALPLKKTREQALIESVQNISPDAEYELWVEPVYLQASQAEKNLI